MSGKRRRRTYDKAFKYEAVRLVLEEGRSAAEVERNLGTGRGIVSRWVRELTEDFPGKGHFKPPEEEIHALKRELERVKRERDILKKAVAIFSTEPERYSGS